MNTTKKPLTWRKLATAEPALKDLLRSARQVKRTLVAYREGGKLRLDMYRAYDYYANWIRPSVDALVGWRRTDGPDFLMSMQAHSIAIRTIYDALPPDFTEVEVEAARERAEDANLWEGESMTIYGPAAEVARTA